MRSHTIESERSSDHWPFLNTNGEIVLDLGCGRHGTENIKDSSPFYLGDKSKKIIAVDSNPSEINYFISMGLGDKYVFLQEYINTPDKIRDLILKYNPTIIKCDIEEHESNFLSISKEDMSNVKEVAIEYHTNELREMVISKMSEWGFVTDLEAKFGMVYAPQMGVIFAKR